MNDEPMETEEKPCFVLQTETDPMRKVFGAPHLMLKIFGICREEARKKLFVVGTRTRQGDLARFLNYRLVCKQFNEAVCMSTRIEFKSIKIDMDDFFLRCNDFTIGKHQRVAAQRRAAQEDNGGLGRLARILEREVPMDQESSSDSDSEDDDDFERERQDRRAEEDMPREQDADPNAPVAIPADEALPVEDGLDVVYLMRFLKWLETTFAPTVDHFKIFDSWSFKPCSLPESWIQRLQSFNSMHPDMEHCVCDQCTATVHATRKYFGTMSFRMMQQMWKGVQLSYGSVAFTDAFLADIANDYTISEEARHRFDVERFTADFGGIQINELLVPIQTVSPYRDDDPKPMPLEVIQLLIKLWRARAVNFEMLKFMDNDYYVSRREWEDSGAFSKAYFSSFDPETFDVLRHVTLYQEKGTLDKDSTEEVLPFFDLRVVSAESSTQMGSDWSIASRMSRHHDIDRYGFEWPFQGRVVFNMFKTNRAVFIESGANPFPSSVGLANWLKYTIRSMMRYTWGARDSPFPAFTGKTAYWIFFMDDVTDSMRTIWHDHMEELLIANFPRLNIRMHRPEPFEQCSSRRIATYEDTRRPEAMNQLGNIFYVSFHDPVRNNTTHMKFLQIQNY